uniref:Uncharacterized protein n=1 Tax=Romanomermis culicivorax TaxID=13658 RepID=A0A915L8Z5_ROMCU
MVLLLVGEAKLHFLTLCLLLYTSNNSMVICKPLQQNSNDRRRSTDQYLMTIDSKLIIDQNLAKLMNFRRMLNEKLLIDADRNLINMDFDDNDDNDQQQQQQRNLDQKRSISKNQHHHHHRNRRINRKKSSTFSNDLLNELLMADSSGVSEKSSGGSRTFRINANLNSSPSQSNNRNNQRMMDRSSSSTSSGSKNIVRRNDAPFAASLSDGYSAECPRSRDKPHQIMCPSRRKHGYHVCIDETALCNGVPDCPQGEDENPSHCMFYKTSMRYFKTVVDQVVQLSDTVLRIQSRQNDEL